MVSVKGISASINAGIYPSPPPSPSVAAATSVALPSPDFQRTSGRVTPSQAALNGPGLPASPDGWRPVDPWSGPLRTRRFSPRDFADSGASNGETMTKANDGKKDTRTQKRDDAVTKENFIDLQAHAKAISLLLTSGLTIFLACQSQYFYALCSACLTLAAVTSDRLKKIKISLQSFHAEWNSPGRR
jgi:hypothetical protein